MSCEDLINSVLLITHSVLNQYLGGSAVVEVKSLQGKFALLRKRVTSADFIVTNYICVILWS